MTVSVPAEQVGERYVCKSSQGGYQLVQDGVARYSKNGQKSVPLGWCRKWYMQEVGEKWKMGENKFVRFREVNQGECANPLAQCTSEIEKVARSETQCLCGFESIVYQLYQ